MASPKRRIQTSSTDWRKLLSNIHRNTTTGTVDKLFEDDYFAFELIKTLHEDSVDVTVKMDFLSILEQYGSDHVDTNSLDQVVSLLLDLLRDYRSHMEDLRFVSQLLLTTTTFVLQNDLMNSEFCTSLVIMLWEMISKTNDIPTRRLRGCACQCLRQIEMRSPGLLLGYRDRLVKLVREERTDIFQDYASLLAAVLTNLAAQLAEPKSISAEDIVPHLSFLMDNSFLFTPEGLWPIVLSVVALVKSTVHVAPTIFKPLMLHNMATFDPCLFHMDLYIQEEFHGEILTKEEESMLQRRLVSNIQLLSLPPALRLLLLQWLKPQMKPVSINSEAELNTNVVARIIQQHMHPSVFDSLDIHIDKLTIWVGSLPVGQDQGLINDIHYLKRLTLTTGNEQVAVGLYRVLYASLQHHKTQAVANIILKITQDLVVDYPHLIPVILDFLLAVKENIGERVIYMDALSSLHSQVLNSTKEEVLSQFRFFLQVLSIAAQQQDISQIKTLRFLLGLVRCARDQSKCTWELGTSILATCRSMLLHHSTSCFYYEMGELLLEMMISFTDSEISNRARLQYSLLTNACDEKIREVLGAKLLGGNAFSQNITSLLSGSLHPPMRTEIIYIDEPLISWKDLH
ncbi:AP-5 complex subunit beta-1-like isoform X2 [Pomacea canaliculata]|nr:AP-5 complex subunit beta-1-like isoform X2 [Pomacea canaliculata]XP_025078129.1 AP-5 complex subunit beta-1-like isoform X2 [Pomacea canaliculata]